MIDALHEARDGSLWVASDAGVFRLHDGKMSSFGTAEGLPGPRVRAFATDASGTLWVGGAWGIARLDSDRFVPWTCSDGFPGGVSRSRRTPAAALWAGTTSGLVRVRGTTPRVDRARPAGDAIARVLYPDRDGNLWLGTENGLLRFRDGQFLRHGTAEGLSSDRILSVAEDREGSLWIGTSDGGLNRIKEQRIATSRCATVSPTTGCWSVFEDRRGTLWAVRRRGRCTVFPRARIASSRSFRSAPPLCASRRIRPGPCGSARAAEASSSWSATGSHASRRRAGSPPASSRASSSTAPGTCGWGRWGSGLHRLSRGRWTSYRARDGLGSDGVFSILEDRAGALWVGTFGGGVVRVENGKLTRFTTADGLAHDVVMSAYQDADGTTGSRRAAASRGSRGGRFTTYRQREGLFHDAAQRVIEDGRGYFWLTSNRGVFRVSASELAAVARDSGRSRSGSPSRPRRG